MNSLVVDYGMGNVGSIVNMGRAAGHDLLVSSDAAQLAKASKLILPGVGSFDTAMMLLNKHGISEALNHAVLERRVPILGVCLGMQLFAQCSEEGESPGLGWIAADTVRFRVSESHPTLKVPHMGWNQLCQTRPDPLLHDLPAESRFYFVHSYHLTCDDPADVLAHTMHGISFCSMVRHDNIWGVQFHPEKSHRFGLKLLSNFLSL
jgi:glutamine amidotransferase